MEEVKIPEVVDIEWARKEMERVGKKSCWKGKVKFVNSKGIINILDLDMFSGNIGDNIKTYHNGRYYTFEIDRVLRKNNRKIYEMSCLKCGKSRSCRDMCLSFSCVSCSSTCSLATKVMDTLLKLNNISFNREIKFNFLGRKAFDFLIVNKMKCYLIEIDGEQHYQKVNNWNYTKTQKNDKIKEEFCKKRGIKLIRFNTSNFYLDSFISDILSSEISYLFENTNLHSVLLSDIDDCKYKLDEILVLYNKGISQAEICRRIGISSAELSKKLLTYGVRDKYGEEKRGEWRKKKVRCINTGEEFDSLEEARKYAGIKTSTGIWAYLSGRTKSAGKHPSTKEKLYWEYVEVQEENNTYSNNEENLHIA